MTLATGGNITFPQPALKQVSWARFLARAARRYLLGVLLVVGGGIWLGTITGGASLVHTTATTFAVHYPRLWLSVPAAVLVTAGVFLICRYLRLHDNYFKTTRLPNVKIVAWGVGASLLLIAFCSSFGNGAQNQRVADWGLNNFGLTHFNDYLPAPLPIFNDGVAPDTPWFAPTNTTYTIQDSAGHNLKMHYVGSSSGDYTLTVTK